MKKVSEFPTCQSYPALPYNYYSYGVAPTWDEQIAHEAWSVHYGHNVASVTYIQSSMHL